MIKINTSVEFKRLIKALSDDVVDAHIHYLLYEDLSKALESHPLVAQQSKTFWTYTLQAHLNSSIYALFRVYDQNKRSLHLRSWLITIQDNLHLFDKTAFRERLKDNPYVASLTSDSKKPDPAELKQDIVACSCSEPVVNKLIIYRGNRIAHRNAKLLIGTQAPSSNQALTFQDLNILLERAKTILNRYSYLFEASVYSTKIVGRDDYNCIFMAVEEKVNLAQLQRDLLAQRATEQAN